MVLGTFLGIFVVVLGLLIRAALSIAMMQQCAPGGIPFAITDANLETRGKAIGCVITVSDFVELSSFPAMAVFVWLPLFALGILVARALTPLSSIVTRVQWALKEGDKHPLKLSDASLAWPYLSSAPGGKRCSKRSAEPIS